MSEEILKKYIQNGVIDAELNELFGKIFQTQIYAGSTIKHNHSPMRISIKVLNPQEAIGENKFKLIQLQNMIAQRLDVPTSSIDIVFEKIADRGLEPAFHAEQLRLSFLQNKPYKRVINSIIRSSRAAGAQGVMIRVAGKLKGQRAKALKYFDGYFIQSGMAAKDYVKVAKSQAKCKQGTIGVQVSVMLPHDPEGIIGPSTIIPDRITIRDPKSFN
ncbi:hypothetical protein GINT2_001389 [Glugoides intestinalis]